MKNYAQCATISPLVTKTVQETTKASHFDRLDFRVKIPAAPKSGRSRRSHKLIVHRQALLLFAQNYFADSRIVKVPQFQANKA